MIYFKQVVVILSLLCLQAHALKARSKAQREQWAKATPGCKVIEWEANKSAAPCWFKGECEVDGGTVVGVGKKQNVRGNIDYLGPLVEPTSVDDLVAKVKSAKKILVIATGHSTGGSTAPEPTEPGTVLMSLWKHFRHAKLDTCKMTLTVGQGVAHEDVSEVMAEVGKSLPSWLLAKHFSIMGLVQNNAVGLALGQSDLGLSRMMIACKAVNGKGQIVQYQGFQPTMRAFKMSLGELGVIYEMTMWIIPDRFNVQVCMNFITLDEMWKLLDMDNPIFPGIMQPWNDATQVSSMTFPVHGVCGSVFRTNVGTNLSALAGGKYAALCAAPVDPPVDFNAPFKNFKAVRNFPRQYQDALNAFVTWAQTSKPATVIANWPKILKMYPNWMLPTYPFHPEKAEICFKYSTLMQVKASWNVPRFQPQWMDAMISAPDIYKAKKKTLDYVQQTANWYGTQAITWDRVSMGMDPRPYLSFLVQNMIRFQVVVFGAPNQPYGSAIDKLATFHYMRGLQCKLNCEKPITPTVGYHLGTYMPTDIAESPGFPFPDPYNLGEWIKREKQEDPDNKFASYWGGMMKKRYARILAHPEQVNKTEFFCEKECKSAFTPFI